ncbi:MAG: XRE family transcriptional regulator, partial [Methylobacteriaceae bacterium]|nr:XRE family transcriptional regulator [Methylobacteriaceae bacterium]
AARSHPNLMVLERPAADGEKAAPKTIPVEAVRKALGFFASTAADGGHRVCLIDAAEDLNAHGLNALLKTVEEPPENATILIVSHAPQRLLPTIRSRCRKLTLAPLGEAEVSEVLAGLGPDAARLDPALVARAAGRAEGSVGRALALLDARRLATLAELETILEGLPAYPTTRVLALADKLADKRGEETFRLALDRVLAWSAERLRARAADGPARLAWLAAVCEKVADEARLVEAYNLDRRAFVLSAVGDLAEAVRRAG